MNKTDLRKSIDTHAEISHARSSGPGGQNVNKVNTKVILRINLTKLDGLSDTEMHYLRKNLGSRLVGEDEVVLTASESRSQNINLKQAFSKIETLISECARLPKHRRATKPSKKAIARRREAKHAQSLKKQERRYGFDE